MNIQFTIKVWSSVSCVTTAELAKHNSELGIFDFSSAIHFPLILIFVLLITIRKVVLKRI